MVQNVLGQATEMEVITEAVASEASEGAADFDEKVKEAQRKNWLICWKNMSFKDLHGFPLWETQLHDVLQGAFPELSSVFTHYAKSGSAGTTSAHAAETMQQTELVDMALDCDLTSEAFPMVRVQNIFERADQVDDTKQASDSDVRVQTGEDAVLAAKAGSERMKSSFSRSASWRLRSSVDSRHARLGGR